MTRPVKFAVSVAVWIYDRFVDDVKRLLGRAPTRRCVILYYHEVNAEDRERFASQMAALQSAGKLFRLESPPSSTDSGIHVGLTFDDAFVSVRDNALPALEHHRIPATIFVPTGSLGVAPRWVESNHPNAATQRVMSEKELSELARHELLTMASHSISHPRFPTLNEKAALQEFAGSRASLEKLFDREIRLFSFPHGAFNDRLIALAKEAGYERVFSINPVCAFETPGEYVTGRVHADPGDSPFEIRLKAQGAYRWLPSVFALKRRLLKRN